MSEQKETTPAIIDQPKETAPVVLAQPMPAEANLPATAKPELVQQIDLKNNLTVLSFGSSAQSKLQEISQQMLSGVKNKDVGPAGDSMASMITAIRGFTVEKDDLGQKRSLVDKLMGRAAPIARFRARFESVQSQIDKIANDLNQHQYQLLKDVASLDTLYEHTRAYFNELGDYIEAGEAKLAQVNSQDLPAKMAQMEAADEDDKPILAQEYRDLTAARDDLERRVHDLKLTRQVTMQSLPSIRMVQENDKALVTKITSILQNTVPLWETQMAQAITINRMAEAAEATKRASDLTNDLLTANAKNLRAGNAAVRAEMERGVFDIEAVRLANAELIGTIEDSLRIADEGKAKRAAAEGELVKMESDLRQSLMAARAKAAQAGRDLTGPVV